MLKLSRPAFSTLIGLSVVTVALCGCTALENLPQFWDAGVTSAGHKGGEGGEDPGDPGGDGGAGGEGGSVDEPVLGGSGGGGGGSIGGGAGVGGSGSGGTGGSGGRTVSPSGGADGGTSPSSKDGGVANSDGSTVPTTPAATCMFQFTVTTKTMDGDYSPDNIGAVWIATSAGKFVKTMNRWADDRISYLLKWNSATKAAGVSRNTVDAVTGATAGSHKAHAGTWNCTDFSKNVVPYGAYQVCMEMTETEGESKYNCVPFMRGTEAFQLMPPNEPNFVSRSIKYTPQ